MSLPCIDCGGLGKCLECRGDKDVECIYCHKNKGKCGRCKGTGKDEGEE